MQYVYLLFFSNMYNTAASEYQVDFRDFSNLIVHMVKTGFLSVRNFRLVRVLIRNNCINYDHMCLYLKKLLDHLCDSDVSCNTFQNVLNHCINSYLMSVFKRSVKRHFEEVMHTAKLVSIFGDEFAGKSKEYVMFSVYDLISYYSDNECLSIEMPVEIVKSEKDNCDVKENLEQSLEVVDCIKENRDVKEIFEGPVVEVEKEKYDVKESLEVSLENVNRKKEICDVKENVEVPVEVKEKCHVKESHDLPAELLDWKKKEIELPFKAADCKKLKCEFEESLGLPVDYAKEKPCDVKKNLGKKLNIVDEKGFESFILPLQQDYTKSSEGYRLQEAAVIVGKQTNTSSCNNSKLDEFDYDRELSENCTSSLSVIFKNEKIERQKGLGSTCTSKYGNFLSSGNEHTDNANQTMLKICDNLSYIKSHADNNFETMPSESWRKEAVMPPADLNCSNEDENIKGTGNIMFCNVFNDDDNDDHSDGDDSIIVNVTCETVEAENDDSCSQDDDCTDLMSDTDDSDDSVIFSEETFQGQSLTFCLTQFCVSPADSDCSESPGNDDDDDWYVDDRCVPVFENCDFEISDHSGISLSQEKIYTTLTPVGFEGYVNECFEDEDDGDYEILSNKRSRLKIVNDNWNSAMKEFPSEPRESKKVSFMPFPDLVAIRCFEPEDDDYKYSVYVMDQMRFRNRISAFETIMTPYLTPEHRTNVYQKYFLSEK